MIKFCAEPTCHTRIDGTEIVCSLHKSLIELDEFIGEILESEIVIPHEHICPDCGHYFECSEEPCHDFNKSCEPCVESDDFDRANEDLSGLDGVLSRLA